MSKQAGRAVAKIVYCGVDGGAGELVAAAFCEGCSMERKVFANRACGHGALLAWLRRRGAAVRVSLEATGVYSVDLALALEAAGGMEVAVLNPKLVHRFAQTLGRSKTDPADAEALAEYSRRMPFVAWRKPEAGAMRLRAITRHLAALTVEHTRQGNRLHAARGSEAAPGCVVQDLKRALAALERRILKMRRAARAVVAAEPEMERRFHLLTGMPGIAEISALDLLGELALLGPELTARQWVAHSGLDPAHHLSGTSVHKPSRISRAGNRHLRRALYMPALVAARRDPHLRAFYEALLARHKASMQALIAVARKMLHAIHGIFKSDTPYDGHKLFPQLTPTS